MNSEALAPLLMIASGSIHAVINAIIKGGRDKMAGRALTDGSSALFMLPTLLFVPWPTGAWWYFAGTAVAHAVYLYALVRAYQVSDLSAAYPVLRGTAPLVTALVTVGVLGEHVSMSDIVGIALIGGSMFALVLGRHLGREGLGWSLLTGVSIAGYTVIDAMGVRAAPTPFSYIACLRHHGRVHRGYVRDRFEGRVVRGGARAMAARGDRRRAVDRDLRHGALRDVDRTDRATRRVARNGHGDRIDRRDRVLEGARDTWRGVAVLGILGGAALILVL